MSGAPKQREHVSRRGGVLLEFAIVALVFYVLFAAVVDMGRASFMASAAYDAARLMARELALAPLPSHTSFEGALQSPLVTGSLPTAPGSGIYDSKFLAIDLDTALASGQSLDEYFGTLPIVNRALRPLMFHDNVVVGGALHRFFRYPGTIVQYGQGKYTVIIPELEYSGNSSTIVRWLPVVQEIRQAPPGELPFTDWSLSPFSALSPEGGIAAVRVNVPFQSSASAGRSIDPSDSNALFEQGFQNAVLVSGTTDTSDNIDAIAPGGIDQVLESDPSQASGAYAGSFGLGQLQIIGTQVRPFRKILSAQSIFRREIFAD